MMTLSFRQNQLWRLGAALFCMLLVVAACTKEEVDDAEIRDIIANQMEGDLLSAAEAADVAGMTLMGVDTVITYNPDNQKETIDIIYNYEDKATNRSKSILKPHSKAELSTPQSEGDKNFYGAELFRNQTVYKVVDEMPRFPGCEGTGLSKEELDQCAAKKMLEFIYQNITYPASARKAGIEGTSVISFIVGTDGEVLDQRIKRNPADGIDEQAAQDIAKELLRITSEMPAWVPGKRQGEDVQVRFNLPVKFKLS